MLQTLDSDLWTAAQPLRFLGVEVGARMTVVRMPSGRLLVHSPIDPADGCLEEVATLGEIAWLVAPNRFHHLYVGKWAERVPMARIAVASGLVKKRPDLQGAEILSADLAAAWEGSIEGLTIDGFPLANEFVLFHRPTATLIAADLAFHIDRSAPPATRWAIRMTGTLGELAPTLLERLFVRDRAAFRASLERVLEWPFERVIVSHGAVLERGGREQLARGYAWLLGEKSAV